MTPKFKRILIAEIITLALTFIPIPIMYYVQTLGEDITDEMIIYYAGLNAFLAFPFAQMVLSSVMPLVGYEPWLSAICVPAAFMIANTFFIQLPVFTAAVYAVIYFIVGLGVAFLISRFKKRKDDTSRYLGRR